MGWIYPRIGPKVNSTSVSSVEFDVSGGGTLILHTTTKN